MPADRAVKIPPGVSVETAAAVLLKGMTVEFLLRRCYLVKAGEPILVHAAAGGVGQIMTQWAKAIGAEVIATVGSEDKAQRVRELGADHVILYREQWLLIQAARVLKRAPYITLVNLLAGKELFPEFLTSTGACPAEGMAEHILRWLNDAEAYEGLIGELTRLREQVAEPGACERAARCVLEVAETGTRKAA